jgi:hypothetical protein
MKQEEIPIKRIHLRVGRGAVVREFIFVFLILFTLSFNHVKNVDFLDEKRINTQLDRTQHVTSIVILSVCAVH